MVIAAWRPCRCFWLSWYVPTSTSNDQCFVEFQPYESHPDSLQYTDVLADFVILILPIPMVLSIKLDIKKKLAVIGMLMLGAA